MGDKFIPQTESRWNEITEFIKRKKDNHMKVFFDILMRNLFGFFCNIMNLSVLWNSILENLMRLFVPSFFY